jgi:hypothetical protein
MVSEGNVEICKMIIIVTLMSIYFKYLYINKTTDYGTLTQVHSYCISVTLIIYK